MRIKIVVAVAVMAVGFGAASANAAPTTWDGWQGEHSDNLLSPAYPATFGNNGTGDSRYCVDPVAALTPGGTHCGAAVTDGGMAVYSPVMFAGVFKPAQLGCGTGANQHEDYQPNPCNTENNDQFGAIWVGTAPGATIIGLQA